MLLYQLKAARQHFTRLGEGPVDGRRSTREDRLDAVENLDKQELKPAQLNMGNVIYDNKQTVYLDDYALHWNAAIKAQDQLRQNMNPEINAQSQQPMHQRTIEFE